MILEVGSVDDSEGWFSRMLVQCIILEVDSANGSRGWFCQWF